jgi:hypothetical protein
VFVSEFALPVPDHILALAKRAATEEQMPLDQLLVSLISEGLKRRTALRDLEGRAARADVAGALRRLNTAPDIAPDQEDEPTAPRS